MTVSTLPAIEGQSKLTARNLRGFLSSAFGILAFLFVANAAGSVAEELGAVPTYLHYGSCLSTDGVRYRARYNDLFHHWKIKTGKFLIWPRYEVKDHIVPDAQCISEDGLRTTTTTTKSTGPQLGK